MDRVRPAPESVSLIDNMLHRSTPRAANINYIENSTFQYNWLHQFVCLISGSRNTKTGSPANPISHCCCRMSFGCSRGRCAANHFQAEL
jgi:hypothetical protein